MADKLPAATLDQMAFEAKAEIDSIFVRSLEAGGMTMAEEQRLGTLFATYKNAKDRLKEKAEAVDRIMDTVPAELKPWDVTRYATGGVVNESAKFTGEVVGDGPSDARYFAGGAYRDRDENKLNYEGFLSAAVLKRYAEYMHKNRKQSDGKMRKADNWQAGIPVDVYMESIWRHFMDVFLMHDGVGEWEPGDYEESLCAVIFNAMGLLHEELRES